MSQTAKPNMPGLENTLSAFSEGIQKEFQEMKAQFEQSERIWNERLDGVHRDWTEHFDRAHRDWNERFDRVERDRNERFDRLERDRNKRLERLKRSWNEHFEQTQRRWSGHFEQTHRNWNDHFERAERKFDRRFEAASRQVARRFKRIDKDVLWSARAGYSRALNSSARTLDQPLYPIPVPDGRLPGSLFPDTFGDLVNISEDILVDLLLIYELADEDSLPESVRGKRELFAEHCGIRLLY